MCEAQPDAGAWPRDDSAAAVAEAQLREELQMQTREVSKSPLWLRLGICLAAQGREPEAYDAFDHASRAEDASVALRGLLHMARLASEAAGTVILQRAVSLVSVSEHPDAAVDIASALLESGQRQQAAGLLRRVVDDAPPPAPRSTEKPAHRRARAVAAWRLAELLGADGFDAHAVDELLRQAVDANDPGVTPMAALELAERYNGRSGAGCAPDELLGIAWQYEHPVASPLAGRRLAKLYLSRGQTDRALGLLESLAELYDGELAEWANRQLSMVDRSEFVSDHGVSRDSQTAEIPGAGQHEPPRAALTPRTAIVIGAGTAAKRLLHELNPTRVKVVGVLDTYVRTNVLNYRNLGRVDELARVLAETQVREVMFAIPTAPADLRRSVGLACAAAGVRLLVLPDAYDLLPDRDYVRQLRPLLVEETFGDPPVLPDPSVGDSVRGKSVMIVGAGGTIGAELARQVVGSRPRHLALVDQNEASLVRIKQELVEERRFRWSFTVIADAMNPVEMRAAMQNHQPDVVFLAAGLNHARVAQENLVHATRVNVFGSWVPAAAAVAAGAERIVFVSCNNAALRASAFDMTKALAERAVVGLDTQQACVCAVRISNVFRTSGDVVETFERQVRYGGPLTVTEPKVTRRFVNKHEAAEWILRVTTIAEPGTIYAVDAGTHVEILTLAHRLIQLRGQEPDADIPIRFIGNRPGDKASNQLWGDDEDIHRTALDEVVAVADRAGDAPGLQTLLPTILRVTNSAAMEHLLRQLTLPPDTPGIDAGGRPLADGIESATHDEACDRATGAGDSEALLDAFHEMTDSIEVEQLMRHLALPSDPRHVSG